MNRDGCTMPDFMKKIMKADDNYECCVLHDADRQDSSIPNSKADRNLRICIGRKYPVRAWIYWIAVRLASPFYAN